MTNASNQVSGVANWSGVMNDNLLNYPNIIANPNDPGWEGV